MALGAASIVYNVITKTYPPEQAEVLTVMSMDWIDFGLDWISRAQSRSG